MIVYLEPHAPFTKSAPRSDTLFGAICWSISLLCKEDTLPKILSDFKNAITKQTEEQLPFLISSFFPYFADEKGKILFWPKPLIEPYVAKVNKLPEYRLAKKIDKIRFVSQSIFTEIINGRLNNELISSELFKFSQSSLVIHNNLLMTKAEFERVNLLSSLSKSTEIARNMINRISGTTGEGGQLFYEPIVTTHSYESSYESSSESSNDQKHCHSGYFFLLKCRDTEIANNVKAALRFLGEKGFGGDTSVGRGHCDVQISNDENIKEVADGDRLITLSLLYPDIKDQAYFKEHGAKIFAQLERRKGFIESAYLNKRDRRVWKSTLFMFTEGSTFPRDNRRSIYGNLFNDKVHNEELGFELLINGLAYTIAMKGSA